MNNTELFRPPTGPYDPFAGWARGKVDYPTVDMKQRYKDKARDKAEKRGRGKSKIHSWSETRHLGMKWRLACEKALKFLPRSLDTYKPKLYDKEKGKYKATMYLFRQYVTATRYSEKESQDYIKKVLTHFNKLVQAGDIHYFKPQKRIGITFRNLAKRGFPEKEWADLLERVRAGEFS